MSVSGVLFILLGSGVVYFAVNILLWLSEWFRCYKIASALPGPTVTDFLNHFKIGRRAFTVSAASDSMCNSIYKYAPTFKFWSGPVLIVVITDPQDLEYMYTNKDLLDKSSLYQYLEPLLGKGLLFLNGATWRMHRKVLTPFLHSNVLREYVNEFYQKSITLVDQLEIGGAAGTKTVDLSKYLGLATSDMICKTVLATDMATQTVGERRFVRSVQGALKIALLRVMCPWYMNEQVFKTFSKHYNDYINVMNGINEFIARVVQKKRDSRQTEGFISQGGRRAFVDLVVNSAEGDRLTDEEIREETKTFVTVASAGTTDSLASVLLVLSLKQDIQDKVVKELHDIVDDTDGDITESVVTKLVYMERVIKETQRFFPAVPFMARAVRKDTQLPSGAVVPRGAHLFACILATQRDERNFPNARKFDPDRFLPENRAKIHPFAFVPFSAGPRNCIGQRYAMLVIKTIVATILMRFRLVPGEDVKPMDIADIPINLGVTLTCRNGYKVRLIPRNDKTAFSRAKPRVPPA